MRTFEMHTTLKASDLSPPYSAQAVAASIPYRLTQVMFANCQLSPCQHTRPCS